MLSVLLKILTVLGIIILILIGIILFLLLIVLFVPITYRIWGKIDEEKKVANVKVNWLFGILRFKLNYSGNLSWQLKLLWFDLNGLINKKPPEGGVTKTSDQTTVNSSIQSGKPTDERPKKSISDKVNDLVFKIKSICDKIKEIWGNISYYISFLQEDDTKHLISHCFKVIGNILKSIRPIKLKINAVIGFDSPDTTGKIYGLLCMLYPYYGNNIHITPDFENKILEGTVFCSGRIYICVLLINVLKILLDRKFFKVIHKLNKWRKT